MNPSRIPSPPHPIFVKYFNMHLSVYVILNISSGSFAENAFMTGVNNLNDLVDTLLIFRMNALSSAMRSVEIFCAV